MQSMHGEDITLYGDGRQIRNFCYVNDLVDGLIGLMNTAPDITRAKGRLGWKPNVKLQDGLEKTAEIFREASRVKRYEMKS